ncbi:unnamed protein product [Brassicogethes aeneus]|uniref:Peptidase S1 domain-containing protein n=1 Tax=Brassicogethes aeneus TaxID=1431903 RepID=A0A9P0FM26_BRAAE|nr:unnamed protein product [Brassicogethes aeneus]
MVSKSVLVLLCSLAVANCFDFNGITFGPLNDLLPSLNFFPIDYLLGCKDLSSGSITNGEVINIIDNSHLVWLFFPINGTHGYACSGTLIGQTTVLTAAHCVQVKTKGQPIQIYILAQDLSKLSTDTTYIYREESFSTYDKRYDDDNAHDAGIITFSTPVTTATPIVLNKDCYFKTGTEVQPQGYGKPSDSATTISKNPREVTTTIMDYKICNLMYLNSLSPNNLCTCGLSNKNICGGDSGGPLLLNRQQIGINSFGSIFGCEAYQPSGYTNICDVYDFIEPYLD